MFPSIVKIYFPASFTISWTVFSHDHQERDIPRSPGTGDGGLGSFRQHSLCGSILLHGHRSFWCTWMPGI